MKRCLLGWFFALVSGVALASGGATDPSVEASMLVTGTIVIAPDGSVRSHAVDQSDKISPAINAFIDKAVSAWKFVPVLVDGKPVTTQTKMHLRLIADPAEHGDFVVHVSGASFGNGVPGEHVSMSPDHRIAPRYPPDAVRARVGGTVYVVLKIGRQGQVLDAAAEQVNLTARGTDEQMTRLRRLLAKAALSAADRWTFNVPTTGPHMGDAYWVARVPVAFHLYSMGERRVDRDEYGKWQPYVPGPREIVPWLAAEQLAAGSADTTPDGSVTQLGQGPQLVSPLSGG